MQYYQNLLNDPLINLLFEFLSLSTPRAVVADFSVILLALAITPTAFWDRTPDTCVWHRFILPLIYRGQCPTSGIFKDCHIFSCGMTHAMSRLLHGDLSGAYYYNHLVYIVVTVVLVIYLYNIWKLIK